MSGECYCGCRQITSVARWSDASRGYVRGEHHKYVRGHANRERTDNYDVDAAGCWVWRGSTGGAGYASATFEMRRDGFKIAHRWFYAQAHGGVCPDTLDHLCRNRACVNPDHLEPCSRGENVRRGDVAKLTWEKVADLRASAASMCGSQREMARVLAPVFGISESGARNVLRGARWPESDRPKVA